MDVGVDEQSGNFSLRWCSKQRKRSGMLISIRVEAIAQKSYGSMDRANDLHIIHHACGDAG